MKDTRNDKKRIRRSVGAAIESRREACGIGVDALAKASKVDTSQMVKILRGRSGVSLYSLPRIAEALGCTPSELLAAAFPGAAKAA
jgi:transcriptional regulator with XRE-family HTH domain